MNWPRLKSLATGRLARTALVLGLAGGMLLGVGGAAQAAVGTQPGTVDLVPNTGPVSSTPTWATTIACPSGFQGSALFKGVKADGTTFNLSGVVNGVGANPFSGTLLANISTIQTLSGVANGSNQELYVECWSGASATGTATPFMDIFLNYSADGSTYVTSSSSTPVPIGAIGGLVFAGVVAIGLFWLQIRRRSRRAQPSPA
jgi:hypothetical protein